MLAKYKVDYAFPLNGHPLTEHHQMINDPVACEQFLAELLEREFKILGIWHEGVELPRVDSDRMIRTAAGILAARHVCASLDVDTAEAHHRFGTPA